MPIRPFDGSIQGSPKTLTNAAMRGAAKVTCVQRVEGRGVARSLAYFGHSAK